MPFTPIFSVSVVVCLTTRALDARLICKPCSDPNVGSPFTKAFANSTLRLSDGVFVFHIISPTSKKNKGIDAFCVAMASSTKQTIIGLTHGCYFIFY